MKLLGKARLVLLYCASGNAEVQGKGAAQDDERGEYVDHRERVEVEVMRLGI